MKQPRITLPEEQGSIAGAQSVTRALSLLPLVGRNPVTGIALGEIVEETGLSRPTVRRLLLSLMHSGMVEQDPATKCYMLGEETYVLGTLAAQRFGLLDVAHDSVQKLAERTEDTAFLSVRRDSFSLCVHKEEGVFPIRVQALQVGYRHPLGVGAGSLSMLAALEDDEVEEILEQNARLLGEDYPRASLDGIRSSVAETRSRGWSINRGVVLANSWAIGQAIHLPGGRLAGALSVAAIDSRMTPERIEMIVRHLREAVAQTEARLARLYARTRPPEGRKPARALRQTV